MIKLASYYLRGIALSRGAKAMLIFFTDGQPS